MAQMYLNTVPIITAAILCSFRFFNGIHAADPLQVVDPSIMLQNTFSVLSKDELSLLHHALDDACIGIADQYNISTWRDQYANNPEFKQLLHSQHAIVELECGEMNLTSHECFEDCLYYNNVLSWILILVSGNQTEIAHLMPYYTWYTMGAGIFSYYDAGNPDMCDYNDGTYCYTPALAGGFAIQQHACCLPGSCTGDDALKVLHSNTFCYTTFVDTMNSLSFSVTDVCEPMPRELDGAGPIIVICVFVLFVFLVIIASVWKQYVIEEDRRSKMNINMAVPPPSSMNTFVAAFNIQDIWKSFRSVRPEGKTQYNFLDGIRVWSMSWVIFGHSFLFWFTAGASNTPTLIPIFNMKADYQYVVQSFYMMLAEYGFYSVDSFFFLSGFLATFSIWRSLAKYPGKKALNLCYLWIPLAYFARFLRIAPMLMYITSVQWQVSDQLPGGYHVTSRDTYTDYCNADWYKILFFYANIAQESDGEALGCMGHLWYIQCDMQMFLLLPWILLVFAMNKIAGICVSVIPILVCIGIRLYYGFYYDFVANQLWPPYPPKHGADQNNDSYFQPWTRMSVYFIGVALMLIHITIDEKMKKRKQKFKLPKIVYFSIMWLAGFILMSLVFWPYDDVKDAPERRWGHTANSIYYALGRPAWGFGLAFMTFALKYRDNSDGSKSLVKSFLSLELYQCLGKLTYLMYLVHLLVFAWWALDLEQPAYYDEWGELLLVVTIWMITMLIAIVLWFTMEKPVSNLVTIFLKWLSGANKKEKKKGKGGMEEYYQVLQSADRDKYALDLSKGDHRNDVEVEYDQTQR